MNTTNSHSWKRFATTVLMVFGTPLLSYAHCESNEMLGLLQRERAEAVASSVRQFLANIELQVAFASSLPPLGAAAMDQRRLEFHKILRLIPAVTEVIHIDAIGKEQILVSRVAMDTLQSGKDRAGEPAFTNAKGGNFWFSPVYFRHRGEPYLTMSVRGRGGEGAVTVAEVNLKFLWDVIQRARVGPKGKAYVVDGRGLLVADSNIGLVLNQTELAKDPIVTQVLNHSTESGFVAVTGTDAIVSGFATIDSLGWKVLVQQPEGGQARAN